MGRYLHVPATFSAEQTAPTGNLEGQTESQEAQRSLRDNHPADVDGENDDDGGHNIGQDMQDKYSPLGAANRLGCLKIHILFYVYANGTQVFHDYLVVVQIEVAAV